MSLKKWIRTVSNFNDLIQFHLTCQMLAKLRKRKRKFCVGFTYSTKQARVIRKFHGAVVQRRLRNVQSKTAWCTCKVVVLLLYIILLLFSVHVAVAVVVTFKNSLLLWFKKLCYYGNVTSQFSSLLFIRGTLRSEGGYGRENVAEKVNSRSINLHCDYSKSLTLSSVGEPS